METCSLRSCGHKIDPQTQPRVECRATIVDKKHLKPATKVCWGKGGCATLHRECWEKLQQTMKKVKKNDPEQKMVKTAAETVECFDSLDTTHTKAKAVAALLRSARHVTVFTGAGISTSAGIGDYRGKSGKWTEEDRHDHKKKEQTKSKHNGRNNNDEDDNDDEEQSTDADEDGVNYERLRPTYTHEALVKLSSLGIVKFVISQNGDGLHVLSGLSPSNQLAELHGNVFMEYCPKCNTHYYRNYYTPDDDASQWFEDMTDYGRSSVPKPPKHVLKCKTCGLTHTTKRKCENSKCKNVYLMDSIVNFGDLLPDQVFSAASSHASSASLLLCLGSTLMVTPANSLVDMVVAKKKRKRNRKQTQLPEQQPPQKKTKKKNEAPPNVDDDNKQEQPITSSSSTSSSNTNNNKATDGGTATTTDDDHACGDGGVVVICNRQSTDKDEVCESSGGVRLWADCDVVMKVVMELILPPKELKQWEAERQTRMEAYDKARQEGE
eukprot:TRINITY_DN65940_c11_g5_i1.p1 TRINITY_DN65940_c11_g5~~TRINITY_DN65940_c11_g5_i1.p1  ORF type:complete len:501 (-),score=89.53 TRINITY_DN65940_c11_g5_i1:427-1908(-)